MGMCSAEERNMHISVLEVKAVQLVLDSFKHKVINRYLVFMSDSATVVAYLKKGGTVFLTLCTWAEEVIEWSEHLLVSISARYILERQNVLADQLAMHPTRMVSSSPDIQGSLHVDLFATQTPIHVSPVSSGSHDLEAGCLNVYSFPPFTLLQKVLLLVFMSKCLSMILVAPLWPHKVWYPDLLNILVEKPLRKFY